MKSSIFLIKTFRNFEIFDLPGCIPYLVGILVIPGIYFMGFLLKDMMKKIWCNIQYRFWYYQKKLTMEKKRNKGYIFWRKNHILKKSRCQLKKWKRKRQCRRKLCILLALFVFVYLTEQFPSGQKKHSIESVKSNQVVFAIESYESTDSSDKTYFIVINKQGDWKKLDASDKAFEKLAGQKWDEEGYFEMTPKFLDSVLASELVPFQEGRFYIPKRCLENAINNSNYYGLSEDYTWYWSMYSEGAVAYENDYYTVGGENERDVMHIGEGGERNGLVFKPEILSLYSVFLQSEVQHMDVYDLITNPYIQQFIIVFAGIGLIRILYRYYMKNFR